MARGRGRARDAGRSRRVSRGQNLDSTTVRARVSRSTVRAGLWTRTSCVVVTHPAAECRRASLHETQTDVPRTNMDFRSLHPNIFLTFRLSNPNRRGGGTAHGGVAELARRDDDDPRRAGEGISVARSTNAGARHRRGSVVRAVFGHLPFAPRSSAMSGDERPPSGGGDGGGAHERRTSSRCPPRARPCWGSTASRGRSAQRGTPRPGRSARAPSRPWRRTTRTRTIATTTATATAAATATATPPAASPTRPSAGSRPRRGDPSHPGGVNEDVRRDISDRRREHRDRRVSARSGDRDDRRGDDRRGDDRRGDDRRGRPTRRSTPSSRRKPRSNPRRKPRSNPRRKRARGADSATPRGARVSADPPEAPEPPPEAPEPPPEAPNPPRRDVAGRRTHPSSRGGRAAREQRRASHPGSRRGMGGDALHRARRRRRRRDAVDESFRTRRRRHVSVDGARESPDARVVPRQRRRRRVASRAIRDRGHPPRHPFVAFQLVDARRVR